MKTRVFCIVLCALTILLVIFGVRGMYEAVAPSVSGIDTVLRLACYAPENHPTALAAQYFASLVDRQTGGHIRIQVISGGEPGEETEALEQLSFGGIAFALVDCLSLDEKMVHMNEDGSVFPDSQLMDLQRLSVIGSFEPDFRCIASSKGLITAEEDCRGLSIGAYTNSVLTDQLALYGFSVLPYSGHDLLSSVYYGYFDTVEMSLMNYAAENYAQVLPCVTLYDGPQAPDLLLCSQVSMGNLPSDVQRVIRECAAKAVQYHRTILWRHQMAAVVRLREMGIRFYPEEILKRPATEWRELCSRLTEGGNGYE